MGLGSRIGAAIAAFRKSDSGGDDPITIFNEWGVPTASGVAVNSFTAMQAVAVLSCVSIISEDVAKLPVRVYRRDDEGNKQSHDTHFLDVLLRQPNEWQSPFEFVEMMQAALLLRSNAYAVIIRTPRGVPEKLIPIHPDRVTVWEAPDGQYFYLVTRNGLHEMAELADMPMMIASEDVFHLRWLASWNSLLGMSRVAMAREAIGLALSQEQQAARLAGNGAKPGGVLQTDKKLSPDVLERLKTSWKNSHEGLRNSGKTAILEEGLKWQALGMTSVDAEFMAAREFQLEEIARLFRVPPHKIGIIQRSTGNTMVQMDQDYLNNVITSHLERWEQKLEMTFGLDGVTEFVEFDVKRFLRADIQTRYSANRLGIAGTFLTPNEVRRSEDLPPVAGGDVLLQPMNVGPLGSTPTGQGPGSDATGAPAPGGDGDAPVKPPSGDEDEPDG